MKIKIKKDAVKVLQYITTNDLWSLYTFGNGGSATIANHMAVDWVKNSAGKLAVESLCANVGMIMMIANDYGYSETCAQQLLWRRVGGPALILISSSGKSPNIIEAAKMAKSLRMPIIGFTGFDGGELKNLSDISVHINSKDYEEAEDYHQMVMHQVSRLLRASQ